MDVPSEVEELPAGYHVVTAVAAIIEFVGLPGSGKTTIARHVVVDLEQRRIRVLSRTELAADDASFLFRHVRRTFLVVSQLPRNAYVYSKAVAYVFRASASQRRDALKLCWNLWVVMALIARHRSRARGVVLVLDQGVLQALLSVHVGSATVPLRREWNEVLAAIGVDDIAFVFVKTTPDVARERLRQRPGRQSRMERHDWIDNMSVWRRSETLLDAMASDVEGAVVVFNDEGDAVDLVARDIVDGLHLQ